MDDFYVDISRSLLEPNYTYPFDFLFNDHFLNNVEMQKSDYKQYISGFLLGVLTVVRCWSSGRESPDFQPEYTVFNYNSEADQIQYIQYIISVLHNGRRKLHFVNFQLDNSSLPSPSHLSSSLHAYIKNLFTFGDAGKKIPYDGPFLHLYQIYPINDSSNAMQLVARKVLQQVPSIVDNGTLVLENLLLMGSTHCAYSFFGQGSSPFTNPEKREGIEKFASKVFEGVSADSGEDINHASLYCAVFHGFAFHRREDYFDEVFIHHEKRDNTEIFNLTTYNRSPQFNHPPFMLSFIIHDKNSEAKTGVVVYSSECERSKYPNLTDYETVDSNVTCKTEYSSIFHGNGMDYLSNIFHYCKTNAEKRSQTEELTNYLNQIFEDVYPSSLKQSKANSNYLKYFVMGTFVSTKQSLYDCSVNTQTDILIFNPRRRDYPLIIVTFNADYRAISMTMTRYFQYRSENSFFLTISIDEISDQDHNDISLKYSRREVNVKWRNLVSLDNSKEVNIDWIHLEKSTFLGKILNISETHIEPVLEGIAGIITNAFPLLYADHANSFNPFMQGVFYRYGIVGSDRGTIKTYFSRWTCKVTLESDFLFDLSRVFYFYFLPTLDAAMMFFYSPKDISADGVYHTSIIYNPTSGNVDYAHYRDESQHNVYPTIAKTVCKIYSHTKCKESFEETRLLSGLLPQSISFLPAALSRHLEVIEKLTKSDNPVMTSPIDQETAYRSKRGAPKKRNRKHRKKKQQKEKQERTMDKQKEKGEKREKEKNYKEQLLKELEEIQQELNENEDDPETDDQDDDSIDATEDDSDDMLEDDNDDMEEDDSANLKEEVEAIVNRAVNYIDSKLTAKTKNRRAKKLLRPVRKIFSMFNLGQDIKELIDNTMSTFREPSVHAYLQLTADYANMAQTLFQGGVKLLTCLNVISKSAWVLGPIGTGISAVTTACSIGLTLYDVGKQLITLSQTVKLSTWQIIAEGARLATGFGFSKTIKMLPSFRNEKNLTFNRISNLTDQDWKFPNYRVYVSSYTCGENHSCFGSIIELNKHQFIEYSDSRYYSGHPGRNKHVNILCVDSNILSRDEAINFRKRTGINANSSQFCHSAFALHSDNVNSPIPKALYDMGPHATVKALQNFKNDFRIAHDFALLEGGDEDDFFDLNPFLRCGYINGGEGSDTIKLSRCNGSKCELLINESMVTYRRPGHSQENQCIFLNSIERVIGQYNTTETVFVNCTFTMISLNGGESDKPDKIYLSESLSCVDTISMILSGHTELQNKASGGNYFYRVARTDQGNIKLNISAGKFIEKSHTILIDHILISDFANMTYKCTNKRNCMLKIVDKSSYTFSLIVDETWNVIQIIFKDGEHVEFNDESMNIIVNSQGRSLGSLMNTYGQVSFSDNIVIKFGSQKLGTSIELSNGKMKYNQQEPMPFELSRLQLNGSNTIVVECSSGLTYAVLLNTEQHEVENTRMITFVAKQNSRTGDEEFSLIIDLTYFFDSFNSSYFSQKDFFTIELENIENSETFKATGIVNLLKEKFKFCVMYFDGFNGYSNTNILLLAHSEYHIELRIPLDKSSPNSDAYSLGNLQSAYTGLELVRHPRIFHYHPDYLLVLTPNDVNWNEMLKFPAVFLTIYDLIKIENTIVITSIRSNFNKDIFKVTKSFFTIILKDFYVSNKMQSLILKFGDGNEILTKNLLGSFAFDLRDFKREIEMVEKYLTRKDVLLIDKGGTALKEWMELTFKYE